MLSATFNKAVRLLAYAALPCISACGDQHPATPADRVVTVEKPVAVQPITKDQLPALPPPLGPIPQDANAAALQALAARCEAIAFVIKAWPLLLVSAGLLPAQAPIYPECSSR